MLASKKLPSLKIGHLEINPPFILGGMGVRITNHSLVSAFANCGGAGTIASVGLFSGRKKKAEYVEESNKALTEEIRASRKISKGKIGVNIMVALSNFDELVKTAVAEKADYIISGAGLPLNLPELTRGSDICLIPIVSSAHAADIICKRWLKKYSCLPDAIVVEGALAGGHLGIKFDELPLWDENTLGSVCQQVIKVVKEYEKTGKHIPVIAAGGLFDGKDIANIFKYGAEGVQLATRFICTDECSVPDNFKKAVIESKKEDMLIIKSPVGMPARVIKNPFIEKILKGEKTPINCRYHCLKTCDPKTAPFCIADALVNAYEGKLEEGIIMAGANAYKVKEVLPVKKLIDDLVKETLENI